MFVPWRLRIESMRNLLFYFVLPPLEPGMNKNFEEGVGVIYDCGF